MMASTDSPKHLKVEAASSGDAEHRGGKGALYIGITIALAAAMFAIGSFKAGYHEDEIATFQLSNKLNGYAVVEEGVIYDGAEIWDAYVDVQDGGAFDYANVWANQADDVHPPLYYVLVHTVSSLLPDLPILWVGLLVNVPICCIVYWQLVWIARRLGMRDWMSLAIPATFVLGQAFVSYGVVFFRMYSLLTVWTNLLVMLFMSSDPEEDGGVRYYVPFALTMLGGCLTQYYFLVFAFLACIVYAVAVALARNWHKLFASLGVAITSILVALAIFPAAYHHIFGTSRGTGAFRDLLHKDLIEGLEEYFGYIDAYVFGGLFIAVVIAIVVLAIAARRKGRIGLGSRKVLSYCLLLIPAIVYVLFNAKVSPDLEGGTTMRYVVNVCGLLYLASFGLLADMAGKVAPRTLASVCVAALAVAAMGLGWRGGSSTMYLDEDVKMECLEEQGDSFGVYICDMDSKAWHLKSNLQEVAEMDRIVFLSIDDLDDYDFESLDCDSLTVFVDYLYLEDYDVLEYAMDCTGTSSCVRLFSAGNANVYRFDW